MKNNMFRQLTYFIAMAMLMLLPPIVHADSLIKEVLIDTPKIDLAQGTATAISFSLTEPCKVNLFICDVKGNIVKNLLTDAELTPGDHVELWDGIDEYDSPVVNGIYFPILQCKSKRKGTFVYNSSAEPWGEQITAENIQYDSKSKELSFDVDRTTYGRLRVGLKEGGPVYKTLVPWQLWLPGKHTLEWDGKDVQKYKSVLKKKKLSYSFDAFSMPLNGIAVTGATEGEAFGLPEYQQFTVHPPSGGLFSYFALEAGSQGAEPALVLNWQKSKKKKGVPILKNKTSCLVSFAKPNKQSSSLQGGAELILYLDDEYVVEVPVESLPAEIGFDSRDFDNGKHIVTINLLTSDDRAGISLHEVVIKN